MRTVQSGRGGQWWAMAQAVILLLGLAGDGRVRALAHHDEGGSRRCTRGCETSAGGGWDHLFPPGQVRSSGSCRYLEGLFASRGSRSSAALVSGRCPPIPVFRDDEIDTLVPSLAEALQGAKTNERIAFEVLAPGNDPERNAR